MTKRIPVRSGPGKLRAALLLGLAGITGCFVAAGTAAAEAPAVAAAVNAQYNVKVPMRDGALLSTDIYFPDAPGKYPVLLIRTSYTKNTAAYAQKARFWVSHGYVLVVQDVHGRGDSDGDFYPLVREATDGYDTQQWIGQQPWSSGKIGTLGNSYLGWTQVYAAGMESPYLAAMVPTVTPPDPNRNFPTAFGIPMPAAAAWLAGLDGHINQDLASVDMEGAYNVLPSIDFDRKIGRNLKAWRDWVQHPTNDEYWQRQAYQEKLTRSPVPMMHVSGWYDDVLVGTTENFVNMTRRGPRPEQQMLIGPWLHGTIGQRKAGQVDFGPEAELDFDAIQLRWFDHWLKGVDNGVEREPPVRLFVMGRNAWISEQEWPIARTNYVKYYLRSGGKANSRNGDGTLSTKAPGREKADTFAYDPMKPIPYLSTHDWHQVGGPDDFSRIELRDDMLVYTAPAVDEPLMICGPLKVKLYASSNALDTDWTAKILDVAPDGTAIRLNDGVVRARFRRGNDKEELLTPGKVEAYDIDLWATCMELQKGHSLRLEIASSAFGKTDRNLNSGGPIGRETAPVVAQQNVFHDASRASYLLLPVIPARK